MLPSLAVTPDKPDIAFDSVSAFLCRKVLNEKGAFSALGIGDVFLAPEVTPEEREQAVVTFFLVVLLKGPNPDAPFELAMYLVRPSSERVELPRPPNQPFRAQSYRDFPDSPPGFRLIATINVAPKHLGVAFLEV